VRLAIGLAIGLAGGFGVGRLLSGALAASGSDGVTLMSVTALLVVVMLAACFWPVLRATRLNPVLALRYE
jgi:ABC-type antimicrobial peptide transport system permease subunit